MHFRIFTGVKLKMAIKKKETQIEIAKISTGTLKMHILGTSPLIMHRFAFKAWQELLFPSGRKNAAERAESLKHDPLNEFREAIYRNRDPSRPSAVHIPAGSFSGAMASAALDIPGASKSQIMRLCTVSSQQIDLYGIPRMGMDMVRSSDMAKTPDVRTRPYFPEWACEIEVQYVSSLIREGQVANLMAAAGSIIGIGDWRPQKGGAFGKFVVVEADDPDYLRIVKECARKPQLAAIDNPIAYNVETEELFAWFNNEVGRREKVVPSSKVKASAEKLPGAVVAARKNAKGKANGKHAS